MATVTPSADPREAIARLLTAATGGKIQVAPTNAASPDDPSEAGNLLCGYSTGRALFDFAYIDARKPHPEQELANELRRIAAYYTGMARKLEAKRPLMFRESDTAQPLVEMGIVVMEMEDCREIVYHHRLDLCKAWVKRWNKDDCGYPAVAIPVVQSVAGRKLATIPTASKEGGDT